MNLNTTTPKRSLRYYLMIIGPGFAVAATGVGAGDMVSAAVAGSRYGMAIAWAAIVGAILKYVMNEGVARWQLATHRGPGSVAASPDAAQ